MALGGEDVGVCGGKILIKFGLTPTDWCQRSVPNALYGMRQIFLGQKGHSLISKKST